MTMAIFRDDDSEIYELVTSPAASNSYEAPRSVEVPLIRTKLQIPDTAESLDRKCLVEILSRSITNSAATLLVGRAGSGKTALAANFARRLSNHSWYSIDASDAEWNTFQRYFRAALSGESESRREKKAVSEITFSSKPVELFADITAALELYEKEWPSLIVLDNVHHIFDCGWFEEFFAFLIASLPHTSHVILISRSKPPTPVWRLRSKQVLNVIDENALAFSAAEAVELFAKNGLNRDVAVRAQTQTFGRPADLIAFIESAAARAGAIQQSA